MSSAVSDNQKIESNSTTTTAIDQLNQLSPKKEDELQSSSDKPIDKNPEVSSTREASQMTSNEVEAKPNFHEESDIPTPVSTTDTKEQSVPIQEITQGESASSPIKRKDEASSETPKPKKSRKLQGAGVKKPLYSRYESLYIIKAYKTISDKHPNLVLIDLFKIVAILFNEEAQRQGFKERTPDQLYQKYKRIQHGLNHGETEFLDFFKKNTYNPREWIPDFINSENDEILKYIKFPRLDESINEVVGSSIANLKPPLPDLYDDEDDEGDLNDETRPITEPARGPGIREEHGDAEDELLKLAGYDNENSTNGKQSRASAFKDLKAKVISLDQSNKLLQNEIKSLKENVSAKDQQITFLKSMIKEDLSYIRHKLNEPKASDSTGTSTTATNPKI